MRQRRPRKTKYHWLSIYGCPHATRICIQLQCLYFQGLRRLIAAFFSNVVFAAACGLELAVIAWSEPPCPDAPITLCGWVIDKHPKSVMPPDERLLSSGSRSCPNEASEYSEPKESKLHNSIAKAHEKTHPKKSPC